MKMLPWILGAVFILFLVFVYTLIPYKWPSKEVQKVIEKIPGPKTVPFLGNMPLLNVPSTGQSNLQFSWNRIIH